MAYAVPITVRAYQAGDETSIMCGFNRVFNENRGTDYWRWKFLHNDEAIASVAVDEKQKVHAHIAAHPILWHEGRRQVSVAHAGDAFSLPLPETIHGRAMLKALLSLHQEQRSKGNIQLLFGFPSGTLNALHNTQSPLQDATKVIRRWRFETAATSPAQNSQFSVEISSPCPASVDAFWQRVSSRYALLAQRDWKWINWRFLQRPDINNYEYLHCHDSTGTLRAWAIIREMQGCLWIADLLWDADSRCSLVELLRHIVHIAQARQLRQTALWLQGDQRTIDVLLAMGWQDDSAAHQVTLSMHPYDTRLNYDWIQESLYITKGDSDLI